MYIVIAMVSQQSNEKTAKIRESTGDELYRRSTQYRQWSFTTEALNRTKHEAHDEGRRIAVEKFEEAKIKVAESNEYFQKHSEEIEESKLLELPSFEDEQTLLFFYTKNIVNVVNFFRMPTKVKATAVCFFKRFYLFNSLMVYHPRNIHYTCVFLAAKSENYFMSVESFCKCLPSVEPQHILDLEFTVLQALKFNLLVHHPFTSLYGLFLDIQEVLLSTNPQLSKADISSLGVLYDKAKQWLNDWALLSDAIFLYAPPQIALAALYITDKDKTSTYLKSKLSQWNKIDAEENMESSILKDQELNARVSDEDANSGLNDAFKISYDLLVNTVEKCIKISVEIPQPSREECKQIDKRCFFILNPTKMIEKRIQKLENNSK